MILIPQDSYQIRVANVKEDGHEVMITTATRSTDFQGAASNVACGAMWNAVGHEEEVRDRFCEWSGVVGVILEMSFYDDPPLCSRVAKVG